LNLLLVPLTVTALPIWFSVRQNPGNGEMRKQYRQQGVQETERQPQEAA